MRNVFALAQEHEYEEPRGLVSDAARRRLIVAMRKLGKAPDRLYGLVVAPTLERDEEVDPLVAWRREDRFFRDSKRDYIGRLASEYRTRQARTFVGVHVVTRAHSTAPPAGAFATEVQVDLGTVFERYRPNGQPDCYHVSRQIMPKRDIGHILLRNPGSDTQALEYANSNLDIFDLADFDLSECGLGEGEKPPLPMMTTYELVIAAAKSIQSNA